MTDTLTRLARIMHRLRLRSPATGDEKREWAAIRRAVSAECPGLAYTITEADVYQPTIRAWGRAWAVTHFLGMVLPRDVGKLVYRRGDVLQVENEEQLAARLATVDPCECADSGCKAAPWHQGDGVCGRAGEMHLFRIDMGDTGPVVFCEPCGDNALDSGVFVAGGDLVDPRSVPSPLALNHIGERGTSLADLEDAMATIRAAIREEANHD